MARKGYPDWILLRKGDSWIRSEEIWIRDHSGRSLENRFVIAAYEDNADSNNQRPRIKTGVGFAIRFWGRTQYFALLGLDFYAHFRDPDSPDFVGFEQVGKPLGFQLYSGDELCSILIEDCVFRFYAGNTIQTVKNAQKRSNYDVIIRRSQITNNYASIGHCQGIYSSNSSLLLEENLLDHNGWYQQQNGSGSETFGGQATMFNHNLYFALSFDTIIRQNVYSRASSMGQKLTANPPGPEDEVVAWNILIEDNLFLEGEIGISAGGNDDFNTGYRWKDIRLNSNVMLHLGEEHPTNRVLGWGLGSNDWDSGEVRGNLFAHYTGANINAISFGGHARNVAIAGNIIYGLRTASSGDQYAVTLAGDNKLDCSFSNNEIQITTTNVHRGYHNSEMMLLKLETQSLASCFNNVYLSNLTTCDTPFRVDDTDVDWEGYKTAITQIQELSDEYREMEYLEPHRDIGTYQKSLGGTESIPGFIEEIKKQSKSNWRPEYTAQAFNAYIRSGFCTPSDIEECTKPLDDGEISLSLRFGPWLFLQLFLIIF